MQRSRPSPIAVIGLSVIALGAASRCAHAAPIGLGGGNSLTATESFNALSSSNSNSSVSWGDDATLPGWFALYGAGGGTTPTAYLTNNGGNNPASLLSAGANGNVDRALASRPANATGEIRYGAVIQNTGSQPIASLSVTYTGEQWRQDRTDVSGTSNVDRLDVAYKVATSLPVSANALTGTYTDVDSLDFTAPQPQLSDSTASSVALDGNAAANRTTITSTITGLDIAPGDYIVLRWADGNVAGNDAVLGIDDLSISAVVVPEPSSLAVAGLAAVGLLRRRR